MKFTHKNNVIIVIITIISMIIPSFFLASSAFSYSIEQDTFAYSVDIEMSENSDVFTLKHSIDINPKYPKEKEIVDIIIIADESGSMAWGADHQQNYLKDASGRETTASYSMILGLKNLVEKIWNDSSIDKNTEYRIGLVGYTKEICCESSNISGAVGGLIGANNKHDLLELIENLNSNHNENMTSAVNRVLNTQDMYLNAPSDDQLSSRKYLIVIGDGSSTNSNFSPPPKFLPSIASLDLLYAYRSNAGNPTLEDVFVISFPGKGFANDYNIAETELMTSINPLEQGMINLATTLKSYENALEIHPKNSNEQFGVAFNGLDTSDILHINYNHAANTSKSLDIFAKIADDILRAGDSTDEMSLNIEVNPMFSIVSTPVVEISSSESGNYARLASPFSLSSNANKVDLQTIFNSNKKTVLSLSYQIKSDPKAVPGSYKLFSDASICLFGNAIDLSNGLDNPSVQIASVNYDSSVNSGNANNNSAQKSSISQNYSSTNDTLIPTNQNNVSGNPLFTLPIQIKISDQNSANTSPSKMIIQEETLQEMCIAFYIDE